jgi:hypothetical protein
VCVLVINVGLPAHYGSPHFPEWKDMMALGETALFPESRDLAVRETSLPRVL